MQAEAEAEEAQAAPAAPPPQGTGAVNPGSHLNVMGPKVRADTSHEGRMCYL